VHLRRALLLFAIVLGLAALATSVSRPLERPPARQGDRAEVPTTPTTPTTPETPASPPESLSFDTSRPRTRRRLDPGRQAVVLVSADQAGQVELDGLGLSAPVDPVTPARFEVLANAPVTASVLFTPAGADQSTQVGTLIVSEAREPARSGERSATRTAPDR
jgi:hypothetical protein